MSYFLLLILAWKPVYFVAMYAYKRDVSYLTQVKTWAKNLLSLVNPIGEHY